MRARANNTLVVKAVVAATAPMELAAITGQDPAEAAALLEAAGGNLELALSLYFDGGGVAAPPPPAAPSRPEWWPLVWGADCGALPDAWTRQRLVFGGGAMPALGLAQDKNGPCGVLAVVHARVVAARLAAAPSDEAPLDETSSPSRAELAAVLAAMLAAAATGDGGVVLARWESGVVGGAIVADAPIAPGDACGALEALLEDEAAGWAAPGALCLLVVSAVLSRGVAAVRAEVNSEGGEPPLIAGPWALCTTDLLALLLRGVALGNVGAFGADGAPHDWPAGDVGLLSFSELETGIAVCDALKTPRLPVWLLHGGDHFTLLHAATRRAVGGGGDDATLVLRHWNGLPPAGPRLATVTVTASRGVAPRAGAKPPQYYRPAEGEIDDVVQAHPDDKRGNSGADAWQQCRYEVVLAHVDDTTAAEGAPRPPDVPPEPTFEQGPPPERGAPWRCRACYAERFRTMCFGMNDAAEPPANGAEPTCGHCGRKQSDSGWSIWMPFGELPPKQQRQVTRRYAPKIISVLRTKWPEATVTFDAEPPPSV